MTYYRLAKLDLLIVAPKMYNSPTHLKKIEQFLSKSFLINKYLLVIIHKFDLFIQYFIRNIKL